MGISAFGTLLKMGDGGNGAEVFTTVAEVSELGGPALELDPIETTHHTSTGGWREFVGGLLSGGEVDMTINYDPVGATHDATTGLIADMVARTVRNFQLVFPDAGTTTWSFAALVTKFTPSEPIDDKLSADVQLTITGQPTLA